jgi:membrane-associated protease RseP (regulator of RpoE activity)
MDDCALLVSCTFVASAAVAWGALCVAKRDLADIERWSLTRGTAHWWCVRASGVILVFGAFSHGRLLMRAAWSR